MSKRLRHRPGDLRSLFMRLEELILASSGADVFEEAFKLVAAKLFDEISEGNAFDPVSLTSLDAAISAASRAWRGVFKEPLATQLSATVAVQCAGLLAQYELRESGESLDALFENLVNATSKGRKGQFFTPRYVVECCVRLIQPQSSDSVLDPACGSGAFLTTALRYGAGSVRGFDIDERAVRIAKLLMVSRGWYPSCIQHGDALRDLPPESADVIVTNPPFAGELSDADLLANFRLADGRARIERDVLFLERCMQALRPEGTLAIVLPHNKFAGPSTQYIREWLFAQARVLAVIGLGRNTFLPHTHQKANILLAQRRTAPRNGKPERIFFAQSARDGKNTRGEVLTKDADAPSLYDRVDHDLEEIVQAYRAFRGEQ